MSEKMMSEEKTKRVIDIKSVTPPSAEKERFRDLEKEVTQQLERLPALRDEDWGKIQFMLNEEGSLYHRAQVAKIKAVLCLMWPAQNTPEWTRIDDTLAYDLYMTTYRDALDYLMRAESLLGHLEEQEEALFDEYDLDRVAKLEIFLSWLKRRFGLNALA
ncbi:MAG: hypothetical protein ABI475_02940 [Methylophilaceae bacterium]